MCCKGNKTHPRASVTHFVEGHTGTGRSRLLSLVLLCFGTQEVLVAARTPSKEVQKLGCAQQMWALPLLSREALHAVWEPQLVWDQALCRWRGTSRRRKKGRRSRQCQHARSLQRAGGESNKKWRGTTLAWSDMLSRAAPELNPHLKIDWHLSRRWVCYSVTTAFSIMFDKGKKIGSRSEI